MELLDCYIPVFKLGLQMTGEPDAFIEYEYARDKCVNTLEQSIETAKQQECSDEERKSALLAVVAWLDEAILRSTLAWRHDWQRELLQRKYLNITVAGEKFFTLLNQIEPHQEQLRRVYLFCLQQGFCGRYSTSEEQRQLQVIIAELRALCLSEAWQSWPNDAEILISQPALSVPPVQQPHLLLSMVIGSVLFYAILYFFLLRYTF